MSIRHESARNDHQATDKIGKMVVPHRRLPVADTRREAQHETAIVDVKLYASGVGGPRMTCIKPDQAVEGTGVLWAAPVP